MAEDKKETEKTKKQKRLQWWENYARHLQSLVPPKIGYNKVLGGYTRVAVQLDDIIRFLTDSGKQACYDNDFIGGANMIFVHLVSRNQQAEETLRNMLLEAEKKIERLREEN